MKYTLTYLLLSLLPATAYCQVGVAIQNDHQEIFYIGLGNPLTVAAEGCKLKDILVTTDNGEIRADSFRYSGHYTAWPEKEGRAIIYVKKKLSNGKLKTLDSVLFTVKQFPLPYAHLSASTCGNISQSVLLAQIAPYAVTYEICWNFIITSFTIVIYRNNREIFRRTTANPQRARIDQATKDFFHRLKNKDKVIFKDITILSFYQQSRTLEPMEFTITDAHKYRRINVDESETVIDPITGVESQREIKYKFIRDDDEEYQLAN